MMYRIDFLDGCTVYAGLIKREYNSFDTEENAKQYAINKMDKVNAKYFIVNKVK